MDTIARCSLCGEPMPAGEEMFKYHGFSGNCPKPPLSRKVDEALLIACDAYGTDEKTYEAELVGVTDDLAAKIRAYGEQCRQAGAAEMRATASAMAGGWGALKVSHAIGELPLPPAAEAASPAAGWRPIETAPRDGTHILAKGVRGEASPPTTVHWFGPADLPGLRAGGWYISVQQDEGPKVHPTHWMPLPAPTEEARAG